MLGHDTDIDPYFITTFVQNSSWVIWFTRTFYVSWCHLWRQNLL